MGLELTNHRIISVPDEPQKKRGYTIMKRSLFMPFDKKAKNLLMLAAALLFLFMSGSAWANGTISGTVRDSDGVAITDVSIGVDVITGDACPYVVLTTVNTDAADGTYTVSVAAGTYYLRALNNGQNYVNEWWYSTDTPKSVIPCGEAQPVTVTDDVTTSGMDFELDQGGTIQGTVKHTNGDLLSGVSLQAHQSADLSQVMAFATSGDDGTYTLPGLPTDTYSVSAYKSGLGTTYYGGYSNRQRLRVFVTSPDATEDINFTLHPEAKISGKVLVEESALEGAVVHAQPFDGGIVYTDTTDANGDYLIGQLATGSHVVYATHASYSDAYYDGAYIWNLATKVSVTATETKSGKNLSMVAPGTISGTVYDTQETPAPLANVCVYAYHDRCWSNLAGNSTTNTNGTYSISGLPPGSYYLLTNANCSVPQHYVNEWFDPATGTGYCDQAGAVTVTAGEETTGQNFSLAADSTAYHAPAFRHAADDPTNKYAGVMCQRRADGSEYSTIYAFITGPAPIDVTSLTATGPSGTFTLQPNVTFMDDLGLLYWAGSNSVVQNGTYTFTIKDSAGRTVTMEKTFAYSSDVAGIDSSTMSPADQAYVGTTTPTLSFTRVSGVASHQVFVWDLKGRAVWYQKDITDSASSVTVPSGILQPDTPYYWWVRTKDATGNNRVRSETKTFFTGTKGLTFPEINGGGLLSYSAPGVTGGTVYGFMYGISHNLAPWDMRYFKVTETNDASNYFYIDGQMGFVGNSDYYNFAQILYKTQPLNDGTYNYMLQERNGGGYDVNYSYEYAPIPNFAENTRSPAIFAYVNTNRPTFSWGALSGAGSYSYRVRIWDYDRMLRLYQSPSQAGTTFRIPEGVNLAWGSSYRWQVQAWDSGVGNNYSQTIRAPFTIPPLATYNYTLPGGGGTVTTFRMFTVPLYLGTIAEVLKMMETTLGTYVTEGHGRWRVFMYVNGQYVEINAASIADNTHSPEKVFWIISLDQTQVPFSGGSAPSALYECTLGSDSWQTFGLPWDSPAIELSKIGVTDGTTTRFITDTNNALTAHVVYEYTGTGPHNGYVEKALGDTLTPGTGYFIRVYSTDDVQLKIPPDNDGGHFDTNSSVRIYNNPMRERKRELPPAPPGG